MPPPLRAIILDVDGVLTETASLHERAWKQLFDELLRERGDAKPFTHEDYLRHVDGKPRHDGIRDFLAARGLAASEEEVARLGDAKNGFFHEALDRQGVEVFEDALRALAAWDDQGLSLGAVSSSRNAGPVLERGGILNRFRVLVDGHALAREGLAGKPAPDLFLFAARRLGCPPEACAVVEDAQSGVEAGRRGGFGLVVGVARHGGGEALRAHGAHRVVTRLDEIEAAPHAAAPGEGRPRETTE